jgi:hypothetical protein
MQVDGPTEVGGRFARLLAAKRWSELVTMLDAGITFKGMTPRRFWDADTPEDVVFEVLQHWFDDTDHIEELVSVFAGRVADRHWLHYRVRVRNDDGLHLVDQHGYYDVAGDRIRRLHLMCSGFRPIEEPARAAS